VAISPYVRDLRTRVGSLRLFECAVRGGALRPDGEETLVARFWSESEAASLALSSWLPTVLPTFYARPATTDFHPPTWRPANG
jgi:hypothetical protein